MLWSQVDEEETVSRSATAPAVRLGARLTTEQAEYYNLRGLQCLHHSNQSISKPDPAHAIADFTRAIFLVPDEPSYYWHRAEAYIAVFDFESAIANFKQHASVVNAATARRALELVHSEHRSPTGSIYVVKKRLAPFAYTWGQCLLDKKHYVEALDMFHFAENCGMRESSTLVRRTLAHVALGQFNEALELLYKLTEIESENIELYILRARIYKHLGNVEFANLDIRQARRIDSEHPELSELLTYTTQVAVDYRNRASEKIVRDQPPTAIHYLTRAIQLDQEDYTSYVKRGMLLAEMGQYEEAIQDLSRALSAPNQDLNVRKHLSDVYRLLGKSRYEQRDTIGAISAFTLGLQYVQTDPSIWKSRADCYIMAGNVLESLEDLQKALLLNPHDHKCRERCACLWNAIANKYFAEQNWVESVRAWTRAIEYGPHAEYYFRRARAYFVMQNIEEARADLQRASELDPNNMEICGMSTILKGGPILSELAPFPPQRAVKSAIPYAPIKRAAAPHMTPQRKITNGETAAAHVKPSEVVAQSELNVLTLPPLSLPKLALEEGGPNDALALDRLTIKDWDTTTRHKTVNRTEKKKKEIIQKPAVHQISLKFGLT